MNDNPSEPIYLKKTIEAVLKVTLNKVTNVITVKKIRQVQNVESSDRSAIMFYILGLGILERLGILRIINHGSPKKYSLVDEKKLKSLVEG